ncbi:helix-turn-helix transcriptional regulator [Paenibacillus cellulositrophicus]|uniref:helix-turn-helix transcriptional regulator n=1 Tax=Paenibacillus cellulositrophicus TaxID=562959 RepID=UPI00204055D9|nr:helix-turn-helix transcriptional regulator [Paenibacillus cellulositrophicus]MCM2998575.1 helix-turn-helix transcriptional regulator [Paenibacillus cellulositrophicus]
MNDERRRKQLADFLRSRRLRISPREAGLLVETSRRRITGLRREEVASLSGISLPWYTALEQGRDIHVSEQVLESLVRTLRLSSDERNHLFVLANHSSLPQPKADNSVPTSLQRILDRMGTYPAYIIDRHWNVLAWNRISGTLCGDLNRAPELERNMLWRVFEVEDNKSRIVNWENVASTMVAFFRNRFALYMNDSWFQELFDELYDRSEEFRTLWDRQNVSGILEGEQIIHLPEAGQLTFRYHTFTISESSAFAMRVFTPLENSGTDEQLEELLK